MLIRLLVGIMVCICCLVLAQGVIEHFVGKKYFAEGTLLYIVFSSLILHGSIILVTALFLWRYRIKWSEAFGFANSPILGALFTGALVAIVFLPAGMVLQEISYQMLTWSHIPTPTQVAVDEFNKSTSFAGRAYLALFAIFIAPLGEEILFRGLLFPTIKQMGYPRLALWLSAILWAAIHLNSVIFLPLVVLGLVFAWLYERTNNLLAPIAAHGVFNAINVVLLSYGDYLEHLLDQHLHH